MSTDKGKKAAENPTIPGYRILGQLGTGGMATVYLANQEGFDRQVALKVMAPILAADASYGDRFMREARIAARFSHPNIIAVYDVGVYDNHYYIAMEYHPGGDLKRRLKQSMTPGQAMSILRQLAAALDYAHRKGYIHRDVKPDNVLFREDGSAVLTDFGIARTASGDTQMTQLGMVVGTPKYMSPEQARGQDLDARSDIYSLGVVFYEMLLGKVPFDGKDSISIGIKHVKEPVPPLPPELANLQPLIDRMLAKTAEARYMRGRELIADLDQLRLGALQTPKHDDSGQVRAIPAERAIHHAPKRPAPADIGLDDTIPPPPPVRRRSGIWPGLLLLTAAIGASAYYGWSRGWLAGLGDSSPLKQGREALSAMLGGGVERRAASGQQPDTAATEVRYSPTEEAASRLTGATLGAALNNQLYPGSPPGSGIAAQAAIALADIDPDSLPPIDNQTRIINEMLAEADTLLAAGRLVTPAGSNALEIYTSVLTLDEANPKALAGRHSIALHFIELTDQALAARSLEPAAQYLQQVRQIAPDLAEIALRQDQLDQALQDRQARVAEARASAETRTIEETIDRADAMLDRFKLTGLLRSAEYDLAEHRYTDPEGNNALQKYQQVLRLSPGNKAALEGLQTLTTKLETELEQAMEAGDKTRSLALLQQLQLVSPDNPLLEQASEAIDQ